MPTFRQDDVIKVPFPYTDRPTRQSRQAPVVSAGSLEDAHGLLWVVMIEHASRMSSPVPERREAIGRNPPFSDTRFQHQARWPAVAAGAAGGTGVEQPGGWSEVLQQAVAVAVEHGAGGWMGGTQAGMPTAGGMPVAMFHHQNAARQWHFEPLRQGRQIGEIAQPLGRDIVIATHGEHPPGGRCQRFQYSAGTDIAGVYRERAILREFRDARVEHAMGVGQQ